MTLDGLHTRPATSCGGNASAGKGVTIASGALKKKTKHKSPVALVRSAKKAQPDFPEQSDDSDDASSGRRKSSTSSRVKKAAGSSAAVKIKNATADKTLQLTKMLRSEEAKLSQQLLIASEKGHKHAAYLLLHQAVDRDRCRGMVRSDGCTYSLRI